MAFDLTTVASILKTVYIGPIRDQLNNSTVLLAQLTGKAKRKYVGGLEAYFPLRKGRNLGIGCRPEDTGTAASDLPEPGNQSYDKSKWKVKYDYCGIKITGPGMSHTRSDQGSFLRGLQSEIEGAMIDKKVDSNRIAWHDGTSILTGCTSTTASTTVNVNSTKFLAVGMKIDIRTRADGVPITDGTNRTIATIPSATTFTMAGNAITTTGATADGIYRAGSRTAATVATEPYGIEALVSDLNPTGLAGELPGLIDRTTAGNEYWKSNVLANGGALRPLTLDLMQKAFDETDIASDFLPGLILTSYGGKREYAKFLVPGKEYPAAGNVTLDGGYKGLDFNGVALVADRDASQSLNPGKCEWMYFLTLSSMMYFENEPWGWMDEDGSMLSRVNRKDSYEAFLRGYYNIICLHPNRNTVLKDLEGV